MITTENERENKFREDPLVVSGSAKPGDYARYVYEWTFSTRSRYGFDEGINVQFIFL